VEAKSFTPEEIAEAYEKLIWVQGLVDFVLHAGFDVQAKREAELEGSLISIFSIIKEYLEKVENVMVSLDDGSEWKFSAIWKKEKKENEA